MRKGRLCLAILYRRSRFVGLLVLLEFSIECKALTGNQPNTLSLGSSPLHKTRDVHASFHTCRPATGAGMAATTEDTRPTSLDQHNRKCILHHYCYVRRGSPYSLSLR